MPSLAFLDISLKSEYQSRELILPCCLGLCDAHTQPDPPLDLPRGKVKTLLRLGNFSTCQLPARESSPLKSTSLKHLLSIKLIAKRERVMVQLKAPFH